MKHSYKNALAHSLRLLIGIASVTRMAYTGSYTTDNGKSSVVDKISLIGRRIDRVVEP
jgi:hypothetical protein